MTGSNFIKSISSVGMLAASLTLAACDENIVTPNVPANLPTIPAAALELTASALNIEFGERITLSWTSNNVEECGASWLPDALLTSGSVELQPDKSTMYAVSCVGATGFVTQTIAITVVKTVNESRLLSIAPRVDDSAFCCWKSTAEMILRHYGRADLVATENLVCEIAHAPMPYADCAGSRTPCLVRSLPVFGEVRVVLGYRSEPALIPAPESAAAVCGQAISRTFTLHEIKAEIDANRPVMIALDPKRMAGESDAHERVALIVGYDFNGDEPLVYVNDLFPFDNGARNPYLEQGAVQMVNGQYSVALSTLTVGLKWTNTIYRIQ